MHRSRSIFYSSLMLTAVNLLLRMIGTSFQVYLSGRIGASGIGLLQLTMSVGGLAMIAGMAGIRTGSMYLTAEELGHRRPSNVGWILSGCTHYSLICSCSVALLLWISAPVIAKFWIENAQVYTALRLFACFLPISCLCGVMVGYFTAAGRIGTLAIVEVAEQLISMGITLFSLSVWAGTSPHKACQSVILGSGIGACFTLCMLLFLRLRERAHISAYMPTRSKLFAVAMPLALADIIKSGITTTENLMVPKRLSKNSQIQDPLASFGILSGMVFPVLMFPACILFGLCDLLIPELARCAAAGSQTRIRYLVRKALHLGILYGCLFGGEMFLVSNNLCLKLYNNAQAGIFLQRYSLLIPMLYCDILVDAMTKGLGQQKICVRYNIITSALDVLGLYFLLPWKGMDGYYVSFLLTHILNFGLSIRRLFLIIGEKPAMRTPVLVLLSSIFAGILSSGIHQFFPRLAVYPILLVTQLCLFNIWSKEDTRWLLHLIYPKAKKSPTSV